MKILLAVDPGIRGCGAALFDDGTIVKARYVKNTVRKGSDIAAVVAMATDVFLWAHTVAATVTEVVVELPQIYTAGKLVGDPNDLVTLAQVDGAIAALHSDCPVTQYQPYEWKRQMTKEVCHARIRTRLSSEELVAIEDQGRLSHNTWDAVGIGLFHLGRFDAKRVLTR